METINHNNDGKKSIPIRQNPGIKNKFADRTFFNPFHLYFLKNEYLPNTIEFLDIDHDKIYETIIEEFGIAADEIISSKHYNFGDKKFYLGSCILLINYKTWLYLNPGTDDAPFLAILHHPLEDTELIEKLISTIKRFKQVASKDKIFLLKMQDFGGVGLTPFSINTQKMDLHLNYNDDFMEVHDIIKSRLSKKNDKGLVLLHGSPGTGKTSYVRYLTRIIKKRIIFISPEIAPKLSSPDFLGIIGEYPNSIIVIEDAENIIMERKEGENYAISNLLNLTDGLLSDCLKLQMVCTFNTDISRIDKALLRKGRLIVKYEFMGLEKGKAQRLSDSLGFQTNIVSEMNLTDIFNQNETTSVIEKQKSIGFKVKNN